MKDILEARWGRGVVFQDTASIRAGDVYPEVLRSGLSSCSVVIAVIGPNWLTSQNATGESRLAATDDWVREELAYALDSGIDLIPVLVRGATPPTGMDLPTSIAKLANIQHFELSDSRFRQEVTLLGTRIEDLIFSRYDTVWLRARLFAGLLHRRLVRLLLWGSIGAILGATI